MYACVRRGNLKRHTAPGDTCAERFSDRSSILLTSTKSSLFELFHNKRILFRDRATVKRLRLVLSLFFSCELQNLHLRLVPGEKAWIGMEALELFNERIN